MMVSLRGRRGYAAVGAVLAVVAGLTPLAPASATGARTTRVSLTAGGAQANGGSYSSAISGDGRYVAFASSASNLVPGDTNDEWDVFVRDTLTGVVDRVTVASDGTQSNGYSFFPDVSDDGNRVSFSSLASNLVTGETETDGSDHDVFVHDRRAGTTERVNVASDGSQATASGSFIAASISGDGNYVAFSSRASNLVVGDTNGADDVFVRDLDRRITTRVSVSSTVPPAPGVEGVGVSLRNSISFDGRYVAFESDAPNLVVGDTNMAYDVFVHDRLEATTTRVSVADDGSEGQSTGRDVGVVPAISPDGAAVAFNSGASNLVPGDTNGTYDVFVHHLGSATTTRVSVASNGTQGNFQSGGDNRIRVAAVSDDGNRVAFRSLATNLVAGDTNNCEDVFVHDRQTAVTTRVSVAGDGTEANDCSAMPSITADGRYVAFGSAASNLVAGDTNGADDVFVRDTGTATGPVLSVGDVAVHEGDGGTRAAVFTVSLSEPAVETVTVKYATAKDTAIGTDFTAKSGTLSFAPGTTSATVKVPVIGDTADELNVNESFNLVLASPTGAEIGDGTGVGTIIDDDPATVAGRRLTIGDVAVHEGDAGSRVAVFNVSLSKASTSTVTASFATANNTATGTDFTAKSGSLSFAPGTTSLNVKVAVTPDTIDEADESFTVHLSGVSGAISSDDTGVGTIVDND